MISLETLFKAAIEKQASDLHLMPNQSPVLRCCGKLEFMNQMPPVEAGDTRQLLEQMATPEQRDAFYRDRELDFAYEAKELGRFRVNASFSMGSICLAIRVIPSTSFSIDELELPQICKRLALRRQGLVLVTGPSGSGKSTTLAAMIRHLNENAPRKVVTIEDPIEYLHSSHKCLIVQRELGLDTRSFAVALKESMRQNPDVILVGEMRDPDTISAAILAAEMGHLVLSTIHSMSAPDTVDRIVSSFSPTEQPLVSTILAEVLEGVLCQQLLPRASRPGRIAAIEIMLGITPIRSGIRQGKTAQLLSYLQTGMQQGMCTLDQDLARLVTTGAVTLEEAEARARDPQALSMSLTSAKNRRKT